MENDFLNGVEVVPEAQLIIPVLLILGFALKKIPGFPNWAIVWAVLVLGAIGGVAVLGLNAEGFINGIIAGGIAVTSHQLYAQTKYNGIN